MGTVTPYREKSLSSVVIPLSHRPSSQEEAASPSAPCDPKASASATSIPPLQPSRPSSCSAIRVDCPVPILPLAPTATTGTVRCATPCAVALTAVIVDPLPTLPVITTTPFRTSRPRQTASDNQQPEQRPPPPSGRIQNMETARERRLSRAPRPARNVPMGNCMSAPHTPTAVVVVYDPRSNSVARVRIRPQDPRLTALPKQAVPPDWSTFQVYATTTADDNRTYAIHRARRRDREGQLWLRQVDWGRYFRRADTERALYFGPIPD